MARTCTAQLKAEINGYLRNSEDLSLETLVKLQLALGTLNLVSGDGADEIDQAVFGEGVLAASADIDLDLAGSLTNVFGETVGLASVKVLFVRNDSDEACAVCPHTATEAEIQVGGGDGGDGTNAFDTWITSGEDDGSEAVELGAGGWIMLGNPNPGYAVTADTADILRILNLDGADEAHYRYMILGVNS